MRQGSSRTGPGMSTSEGYGLAGRADRIIRGWDSKRPLGVTQLDLGAQGQY